METEKPRKRKYSLNLPARHIAYLMNLVQSMGSVERVLFYLKDKYELRAESLSKYKTGDIDTYQPRGDGYITISFTMDENGVWGALKGFKSSTGLSISFMVRLMLEWEMNEGRYDEVIETLREVGIELKEEEREVPVNEGVVEVMTVEYKVYPLRRKVEVRISSRSRPPN